MLNFIIRRLFFSIFIIIGVVAFTFALFNLAAGDPAAASLGKNASPQELERFRNELGADLPLFFGYLKRTETFPAYTPLKPSNEPVKIKRAIKNDIPITMVYSLNNDDSEQQAVIDPTEQFVMLPQGCSNANFYIRQNNPFNSQFFHALQEIITIKNTFPYVSCFNFGRSITTGEKINDILSRGIWPSLALMLPIFAGEIFFGILFALIAAAWHDKIPDRLLIILSVGGMSISYLVVIIACQWLFGYRLCWFQLWGFNGISSLFLPIIVGIICGIGGNIRFFRTVFVDEQKNQYLRTAAAKGLSPAKIYFKHLLRNCALQIITKAGAGLPFLFTGSLLLESFFGIPGLGYIGVDAIYNSDIQLLKSVVIMTSIIFVVINLLSDLSYAWADPRIRIQ